MVFLIVEFSYRVSFYLLSKSKFNTFGIENFIALDNSIAMVKKHIMKFNTHLLAFAFLIIAHSIFAQNTEIKTPNSQKKYVKYLDARYEFGAMMGTDTEWSDQIVNSSFYQGLDFRLGFRKTDPNDIYSNVYRRPYFGLGFYSSTFHNADVGYPNALYFFLTIPIKFEEDKKFTLSYSGAYGISYNFNAFDSINNPTNVFLGSERNIYVHLEFDMNYKFNEKWAAYGAVGFKHFSNGSFKQPNFGINLLPVTLGVRYKLSDDKIDPFRKEIPGYIKHNLWNIAFIAGSKNYEVGGGQLPESNCKCQLFAAIDL